MRILVGIVLGLTLASPNYGAADDPLVVGEYLEARNADVWTGPCFANGEMGTVGNRAVLAWKVRKGTIHGVRLDGLNVAAAVSGNHTFGVGATVASRSVVIVDQRADSRQRSALIELAKSLAGETLGDIVAVRDEVISFDVGGCEKSGCASLQCDSVAVKTRCLAAKDSICGHEELFYPSLSKLETARGAYTLRNEYLGADLDARFQDGNARSAVLGTFSYKMPARLASVAKTAP